VVNTIPLLSGLSKDVRLASVAAVYTVRQLKHKLVDSIKVT